MSGVENQLVLKEESLGGSEEAVEAGEGAPGDVLKADQEVKTSASSDIQAEISNGTGEKRKRVEDENENDAGAPGEKNDEGQNDDDVTIGDGKSAEVDSKEIDRKKLKVGETTEKSGSSGWFLSGLWSSGKKPESEEITGTLTSATDADQLGTQILGMEILSEKNSSWSPFSTSNVRRSTSLGYAGWTIKCSGDADICYQMYDVGNGSTRIRFRGNLHGEVSNKEEVEFEVKIGELSNQIIVKVPAESFEINTLKVIQVEDGIIDFLVRETGNGDEDQDKDKDSDSAEEDDEENQEIEDDSETDFDENA